MIAPTLKWAGSKWRIAPWLVSHFPKHETYLEPFFGGGAAFFSKDPSPVELINDLDQNVVNLFTVIRQYPEELAILCSLTPWAQDEYFECVQNLKLPFEFSSATKEERLERSRQFLTASWQMFGRKNVTSRNGWRHWHLTNQSPVLTWNKLPDRIINAAERLMNAQISREDALTLIRHCNAREVLVYADPPYLADTRSHGNLYEHEYKKPEQHLELLDTLESHIGSVVLSGYESSLYAVHLKHWKKFQTSARAQSNQSRVETVWLNPLAYKLLCNVQESMLEDSV
jgi:DNA adenine methylase